MPNSPCVGQLSCSDPRVQRWEGALPRASALLRLACTFTWRTWIRSSKKRPSSAQPKGPVMDMFWGYRCGTVVDPDGYNWMVGTHKAEPTAKEMKKGMEKMMKQQPPATAAAD